MEIEVKMKKKTGEVEVIKYAAQDKYDKNNTVQVKMKLNKNTDSDIIEWLDAQKSKQGAIKELIRNAINQIK